MKDTISSKIDMLSTEAIVQCRKAFERSSIFASKIPFRRGGSVFAEDVPEGDYVDPRVQAAWIVWAECWIAAQALTVETYDEDQGRLQALHAAASALYFDDSSDFKSALHEVVAQLSPLTAIDIVRAPKLAYAMTKEMAEKASTEECAVCFGQGGWGDEQCHICLGTGQVYLGSQTSAAGPIKIQKATS